MPRASLCALAALLAALWGCGGGARDPGGRAPAGEPRGPRIAIVTAPAGLGGDEARAGRELERRWPGRVRHITFPAEYILERATLAAQLRGLAQDTSIKIMVVAQAVPGVVETAIEIRATRPDLRIALISPGGDTADVAAACDLALQPDEPRRGVALAEQAAAMGARAFVHYEVPRDSADSLRMARRRAIERTCRRRGLAFVAVTTLDPQDEAGPNPAERFIREDVWQRLDSLGTATAFFATDCALQAPMMRAVLDSGGVVPGACCPSPLLGLPEALGLRFPEERAVMPDSVREDLARALEARGATGRFADWPVPMSGVATRAAAALLLDAWAGKADPRDPATVQRYLEAEAGPGIALRARPYPAPGAARYLVSMEGVVFGAPAPAATVDAAPAGADRARGAARP